LGIIIKKDNLSKRLVDCTINGILLGGCLTVKN